MSSVPDGAIIGGSDKGDRPSYVIRARFGEFGVLPGKYAIGRGAYVPHSQIEHHVENFEVKLFVSYKLQTI